METYDQKIERVAKAIWVGMGGMVQYFPRTGDLRDNYLATAKAALEEEARDIDVPDVPPKPKRKTKAKLTLPLTVGQRVICRDGKTRTVDRINDDIAHYEGFISHSVGAENGCGSRKPKLYPNKNDAIADAPEEEA